jgi:Phosphoglycerate dehydrogenase and related dehydrogenases
MYNITAINKIADCATSLLPADKYTLTNADSIGAAEAVLVRSAGMHDIAVTDELLCVARAGAGVNNIPIDKYAEAGVVVFNTPGANANAVKELVLLGLLISSRKVTAAIDWALTLKGEGDAVGKLVEKGKSQFTGPEISGKTLGVVGLGAIGVRVANAAMSLGMTVLGYDPFISVNAAWELKGNVKHVTSLAEIYADCDYISLHLPANADTKGMINAESIAMMKEEVRILNFARGELVNDEDMISALEDGKVAAYVTDFPTDAVIGVDGVVALPHLGASTPESEDNCAKMAVNEIREYLEEGNIVNSVNFPAVSAPRAGARVCVIHKNIANTLSQISGAFSAKGINIENMLNKSKGENAYTLLDIIEGGDIAAVADVIRGIEGVIKVRVIS